MGVNTKATNDIGSQVDFVSPYDEHYIDYIRGMIYSIDKNTTDGGAASLSYFLTGVDSWGSYESEYHYYLGRVVGDAISMVAGGASTVAGALLIGGAILGGGGVTVATGGAGAIGAGLYTAAVVEGAVIVTYGGAVINSAVGNVGDNFSRMKAASSKSSGAEGKAELKIDDTQFGKKVGKHAQDYGLDPADPNARNILRNRINDIHGNPTEIRQGNWRGLGEKLPNGVNASGQAKFYIQGNDVVVTDLNGNFVTIL